MKKFTTIMLIPAALLFVQCGGGEETEETTEGADSTETAVEITPDENGYFDAADKGEYTLYGYENFDAGDDVASVSDLRETVEADGAFSGKVSVEIGEVCQKKGCWITFNDDQENSIRVFFKDHFGIPPETATGTEAILYGETSFDTLDVDFQKHLLDDKKEAGEEVAQEDYDAITEDIVSTIFHADAILVKK